MQKVYIIKDISYSRILFTITCEIRTQVNIEYEFVTFPHNIFEPISVEKKNKSVQDLKKYIYT